MEPVICLLFPFEKLLVIHAQLYNTITLIESVVDMYIDRHEIFLKRKCVTVKQNKCETTSKQDSRPAPFCPSTYSELLP